jgi:hypothetical protein
MGEEYQLQYRDEDKKESRIRKIARRGKREKAQTNRKEERGRETERQRLSKGEMKGMEKVISRITGRKT